MKAYCQEIGLPILTTRDSGTHMKRQPVPGLAPSKLTLKGARQASVAKGRGREEAGMDHSKG